MIRTIFRVPAFLPLFVRYYFRRLLRMDTRPLDGNWVYFFRQATARHLQVSKHGKDFIVVNKGMRHKARIRGGASSDVLVYTLIMFHEEYAHLKQMITRTTRPTIIDAGANAGYFALYALYCFPDATIICVEPDGSNCEQVRYQAALNNLQRLSIEQAALWISETALEIKRENDGLEWNYRTLEKKGGSIRGLPFQTLLQKHNCERIDLFKMDIEGSEVPLFQDQAFVAAAAAVVNVWLIEIHDDAGKNLIENVLRRSGYNVVTRDSLIFANRNS